MACSAPICWLARSILEVTSSTNAGVAIDDDRLTSCCSGHLDAATTARDAGVKTLVLVHLTEMMETPGIRERVLADVAGVFEGQVIFAEDLLDVPLGQIETQPIR